MLLSIPMLMAFEMGDSIPKKQGVAKRAQGEITVLPTNFSVIGVYDIDGDGQMELVGRKDDAFSFFKDGEIIYSATISPDKPKWDFGSSSAIEVEQGAADGKLYFYGKYYYSAAIASSKKVYTTVYAQSSGDVCHVIADGAWLVADIDNDGRKDYVFEAGKRFVPILSSMADGTLVEEKQTVTDEIPVGQMANSGTWTGMLKGMLANSMFVDDGSDSNALDGKQTAKDLNGDGILDLIGADGLLYSYDNNKYYRRNTTEMVFPYDIDGDGEIDYVCYDGAKLYVVTNLTSEKETRRDLFSNSRLDGVLFRDFDHDGDIDILAYIGSTSSSDNTYFVFLRNNGDGTFRRKEQNFAGTAYLVQDCRDYDADSCYELLVKVRESYYSEPYSLLKINADMTITAMNETFADKDGEYSPITRNVLLGDFDNNGITEFYSLNTYGSWKEWNAYGQLNSQTVPNTAPQKMAKPTAIFVPETNRLKIAWEKGKDAETSACDLTYELRIGTQPGKGDVLRAESIADGKRMTTREGNQGTMLHTLFNAASLKPGTYYIAVQAIDQTGMGGQFSDEFVYEHQLQSPQFYVSTNSLSTIDTLQVYVKNIVPGATYTWKTSEGEVIEQDAISAKMLFHQQGNHEIGLTMTVEGVSYQAMPHTVSVSPIKYKLSYDERRAGGGWFDWNQDGYIDYKDGEAVYKNKGDGTFEKLLLSTFSDWSYPSEIECVFDYNRDGFPDMYVTKCPKGNIFLNYGEQDFDFDYKTVNFTNEGSYYGGLWGPLIDLNNDGLMDRKGGISLGVHWTQDGVNYSDYEVKNITDNRGEYSTDNKYCCYYDVNRDGFPDIVIPKNVYDSETKHRTSSIVCLFKDNSYFPNYEEEKPLFVIPDGLYCAEYQIADYDNDGIPDLAFVNDTYGISGKSALYFIKGKAEGNSSEVVQTVDGIYGIDCLSLDLNNDGYLDIPRVAITCSGMHYTYANLLIKPNFGYELLSADESVCTSYNEQGYIVSLSDAGDILVNGERLATTIPNHSPAAPAQVAVKQTQDGMLITWSDAVDKETPAMQMRYNISVKRKGKTGDGAFVISPMNGLKDEAAIVPGFAYKQSTQMLVPSKALTIGETYEIQVQSIDLWGAHSPMTRPVEFTMGANGYIEAPNRIARNAEALITLCAAKADSYSINLGDGGEVVKNHSNGQYTVKWNTAGVKNYSITAGSAAISSSITVVERVDVSYKLPEVVYANAPIKVTVSDEMAQQAAHVGMYCDGGATVEYAAGSKTASVVFPSPGKYDLVSYYSDDIRGNEYHKTIVVSEMMAEAEIAHVNVVNNHYAVAWQKQPAYIDKVVIYKESTKTGCFLPIDTVAAAGTKYVDVSSNASVASCRYRIAWLASNGQLSNWSEAHLPMHVMLSVSPLGGFNIMWNAYEGLPVDNYTILRGTTEDTLQPIDVVSGAIQSYTDSDVSGNNTYYYAVAFTPSRANGRNNAPASDENEIRSNAMNANEAVKVVSANRIEIIAASEELKLTEAQPAMQLYGIVQPAYATITRVTWSIVDGDDLASISNDGLLTAFGESGSVTVRATTLDGTNLTAELTIPIEMEEGLKGDANRDKVVDVADVVQIVNYILGRTPNVFAKRNADVNEDGEINVGDLVGIVAIIANTYSDAGNNRAASPVEGGHLSGVLAADAATLRVENPQDFTAFQMLITLPWETDKEQFELKLRGASDHVVMTNWLSEHQVMVVAYSVGLHSLAAGGNAFLQIVTDNAQKGEWKFEDIVFARANGTTCKFEPLYLSQTTGISDEVVQVGKDERMYDLSGRPVMGNSLKKGLYIKGNKKILVK